MRTTGVEKSKWWRHPLVVLYGGPPSETHSWAEGGAHWYYYTDIGLGLTCVGVEFDEAGRVTGSWNQ